jgi:hypothetical protein
MPSPHDAALVGKAGEVLVAAELLRRHIDIAYPAHDSGVDLIAYCAKAPMLIWWRRHPLRLKDFRSRWPPRLDGRRNRVLQQPIQAASRFSTVGIVPGLFAAQYLASFLEWLLLADCVEKVPAENFGAFCAQQWLNREVRGGLSIPRRLRQADAGRASLVGQPNRAGRNSPAVAFIRARSEVSTFDHSMF